MSTEQTLRQGTVSVVVPVYNTAPYLHEALDSVLAQDVDLEVVAVDDGSTDGSGDILRQYAKQDPRVKVLSQRNAGQSAARNTALQHVSGDYVYFMDSDDVLLPGALRSCVDHAQKTGADLLFFDADIKREGGDALTWDYKRTSRYDAHRLYNGRQLFSDMLRTYDYRAVVWLLFVRRSHLSALGLQFLPGIIHEDELFTPLLFMQTSRVACLPQSLVLHRVRLGSTIETRYSERNVNCYLTVFDHLFSFERSPLTRQFATYTLSKVFCTAYVLPWREKCRVLWRALRSRYLRYIGLRSLAVFLLKRRRRLPLH